MCGICGIVHSDPAYPVSEQALLAMRDILEHRGPDDAGVYLAPGVGLGTRRLAILDLSERGHMPMSTPDGRYWITYNGEVFNYRELRAELEERGEQFRSDTDTEVILRLYALEGPRMLDRLNGMFAFGIWDSRERVLFLARDRLGVKPLCYTARGGALYFASEEKSLFTGATGPQFDPGAWEELLCFRFLAGERTPFVGVRRLLPGHYLIWKEGEIQIRRWWNLAERARTIREDLRRNASEWFWQTFDNSVSLRRISDVPVGILLSGGLDSSSIAASLAFQVAFEMASFTVRFAEPMYDEGPIARQLARFCGLLHYELTVPTDRLFELVQTASWLNDGPLVHASDAHLLAIARFAKPRVTVLLSGEGADETLGGYVRYRPLLYPKLLNATRSVFPAVAAALNVNARWGKLARFLALGSTDRFVLFNACDVLPPDLSALGMTPSLEFPFREQVLSEAKRLYPKEPVRQAMYSDQHTFLSSILRRNDRMSMGASIECRVPFLDYRLVEGLAALPTSLLFAGRTGKYLLRRSVRSQLPKAVQKHRKWGFGVPWKVYFREIAEFRDLIRSLPQLEPIRGGPFEPAKVRNVVDQFLAGDSRYEALVTQLVMTAIWYDSYFCGPPVSAEKLIQVRA